MQDDFDVASEAAHSQASADQVERPQPAKLDTEPTEEDAGIPHEDGTTHSDGTGYA